MRASPCTPSEEAGEGHPVIIGFGESSAALFHVLFDTYFVEVHRYVARRLGVNVADDVAAETFLAAFHNRHRFDAERGDHRAWLYGIATNLIRRHKRHEARTYRALARMHECSVASGHEDSVIRRIGAASVRKPLAQALAALSADERDVLLLVAIAELTYDQVSIALGLSYGTVCSRLHRAKRKVRQALGAHPASTGEEENGE